MQTTTRTVPAKALRHSGAVEPAPNVWSFRQAERGQLTIGSNGLLFGSWCVPAREVIEAHWFVARNIPVPLMAILRVRTRPEVFEFSVEPWRLSMRDLPFGVEAVEFSILGRRAKIAFACAVTAAIVGFAMAG